jgi:hypothetical protein
MTVDAREESWSNSSNPMLGSTGTSIAPLLILPVKSHEAGGALAQVRFLRFGLEKSERCGANSSGPNFARFFYVIKGEFRGRPAGSQSKTTKPNQRTPFFSVLRFFVHVPRGASI